VIMRKLIAALLLALALASSFVECSGALARSSKPPAAPIYRVSTPCNGAGDDTLAIQAALTAAKVALATQFWGDTHKPVLLPPGVCRTTGVDMDPRVSLFGAGMTNTSLVLLPNSNRSVVRVMPLPNGYSSGTSLFTQALIRDITIIGNGPTQTGGPSHGIEFVDDVANLGLFYGTAANIENVTVLTARDDGIYGGINRNAGFLRRVIVNQPGHNSLTVNGYDWHLTDSLLGSAVANGLEVVTGGAVIMTDVDIFANGVGVKADAGTGPYMWVTGGSIDRNLAGGIDIESASMTLSVANMNFTLNSSTASGAAPDILLNNATAASITGSQFLKNPSDNAVSYLVKVTGTTKQVSWDKSNYIGAGTNTPYTIAPFSNPELMVTAFPGTADSRIVNGDMEINRRFNATAAINGFGAFARNLDHWQSFGSTASAFTIARDGSSPPAGFKNDILFTSSGAATITAAQTYNETQRIEGILIDDLGWGVAGAKPAVLSYWAKSSLTGKFSFFLTASDGVNSLVGSCNIAVAGTWQYCSFIIPGPTTGTFSTSIGAYGVILGFDLGSGTGNQTTTTGIWQNAAFREETGANQLTANNAATLQISGVRIFPSVLDIPPIKHLYIDELLKAQRYFRKSFPEGTNTGQSAGVAGASCVRNPIALGEPGLYIALQPPMMASPTVMTYNPSAANANWRDVTAASDATVTADLGGALAATGFALGTSGTVATLGDVLCIHWSAESEL